MPPGADSSQRLGDFIWPSQEDLEAGAIKKAAVFHCTSKTRVTGKLDLIQQSWGEMLRNTLTGCRSTTEQTHTHSQTNGQISICSPPSMDTFGQWEKTRGRNTDRLQPPHRPHASAEASKNQAQDLLVVRGQSDPIRHHATQQVISETYKRPCGPHCFKWVLTPTSNSLFV